jgi:hypothetical protein
MLLVTRRGVVRVAHMGDADAGASCGDAGMSGNGSIGVVGRAWQSLLVSDI